MHHPGSSKTLSSKNTSPNSLENQSSYLDISPIFESEKACFESLLNLPTVSCNTINNTTTSKNNIVENTNVLSSSTSSSSTTTPSITSNIITAASLTDSGAMAEASFPDAGHQTSNEDKPSSTHEERLYNLFPSYVHPFNSSALAANFL